jgi:hypothetical protein
MQTNARILERHLWLIGLVVASAMGATAFVATLRQDSVYRATMKPRGLPFLGLTVRNVSPNGLYGPGKLPL